MHGNSFVFVWFLPHTFIVKSIVPVPERIKDAYILFMDFKFVDAYNIKMKNTIK